MGSLELVLLALLLIVFTIIILVLFVSINKGKNNIKKKDEFNNVFRIAYRYDKLNRLEYKEIMIFDDKITIDRNSYILFNKIQHAEASVTKNVVKRRGNSIYINPYREATTYILRIFFQNKYGDDDMLFFGCESDIEYSKYKKIEEIINARVGYTVTPKENSVNEL